MLAFAARVIEPFVPLGVIVALVRRTIAEFETIALSLKNGPPIKGKSVSVQMLDAILVSLAGAWLGWSK